MNKVLVVYASKYGATAEIAEKIGEVLRGEGLETEVTPVKEVGEPAPYGAVVLGIADYVGQWRKEASKFLKNHEQALAGMPVWVFVSGPTGEGDPLHLMQGWEVPKGMKPVMERIKPVDLTAFHGFINPEKLNVIEKQMIKMVKAPLGDFRDWEAITNWAKGIAEKLKG